MKYRIGFVTNSSSSSFILAFENKEEIDSLKFHPDSYIHKILVDSDDFISTEEAVSQYEQYLKDNVSYDINEAIMKEKDIFFDDFEEWKTKNFEEYEKMYQIHYETDYLEEIEELKIQLKERLNNKEVVCLINCYDADPNYDILADMKQCILMF